MGQRTIGVFGHKRMLNSLVKYESNDVKASNFTN